MQNSVRNDIFAMSKGEPAVGIQRVFSISNQKTLTYFIPGMIIYMEIILLKIHYEKEGRK